MSEEAANNQEQTLPFNTEKIQNKYNIVPATLEDVSMIQSLRSKRAEELKQRGIKQWFTPPTHEYFEKKVREGKGWMIKDGEKSIGTFFLDNQTDLYWTEEERQEQALYLSNFIVESAYAGKEVGTDTIRWIDRKANNERRQWIRLDCSSENHELQNYYRRQGFIPVRTLPEERTALFQKPLES